MLDVNPEVAGAAVAREAAVLSGLRLLNRALQLDGPFLEALSRLPGGSPKSCFSTQRPFVMSDSMGWRCPACRVDGAVFLGF